MGHSANSRTGEQLRAFSDHAFVRRARRSRVAGNSWCGDPWLVQPVGYNNWNRSTVGNLLSDSCLLCNYAADHDTNYSALSAPVTTIDELISMGPISICTLVTPFLVNATSSDSTMNTVGTLVKGGVYSIASNFQPFGGAVDIMVVRQKDGTYRGSPFYVCFPVLFPLDRVMSRKDRTVDVYVRGKKVDLVMRVGADGHAYFPTTPADGSEAGAEEEDSVAPSDDDASSVASADVRRCPSEILPSTSESAEGDSLFNGISPTGKPGSDQGDTSPAGAQSALTRDMPPKAASIKHVNAAAFASASAVLQHTSMSDDSPPMRKNGYRDDMSADEPGSLGFVKELCKRLWQTPSTAFRSITGSGGSSAVGYMDGDEDEYVCHHPGVADAIGDNSAPLVEVRLEVVEEKRESARSSPGGTAAVDVDARIASYDVMTSQGAAQLAYSGALGSEQLAALTSVVVDEADGGHLSPNQPPGGEPYTLGAGRATASGDGSPSLSPRGEPHNHDHQWDDEDERRIVVRVQITPKQSAREPQQSVLRSLSSDSAILGAASLREDSVLCSTRDALDDSIDGDGYSPPRSTEGTARPLPAQSPSQLKAPCPSPQRQIRSSGTTDGMLASADAMRSGGTVGMSAPFDALPPMQGGNVGIPLGLPPSGSTAAGKRSWGSWISPFSSPSPSPVPSPGPSQGPPRILANASARRPPLPDGSSRSVADARPGWEQEQRQAGQEGGGVSASPPRSPAEEGAVTSTSGMAKGTASDMPSVMANGWSCTVSGSVTACGNEFDGVVRSSPALCPSVQESLRGDGSLRREGGLGVGEGVGALPASTELAARSSPEDGALAIVLDTNAAGRQNHDAGIMHTGVALAVAGDPIGAACLMAAAAAVTAGPCGGACGSIAWESVAVDIPRASLSRALSCHHRDGKDDGGVATDPHTAPQSVASASTASSPLNDSGEWPGGMTSSSLPEGAAATRWWAGNGSLPTHGGGVNLASAANGVVAGAGPAGTLFGGCCRCGTPSSSSPKLRLEVALVPGWRRLGGDQLAVAFEEGLLGEAEFVREWERIMDSDSLVCRFNGGGGSSAGQILPWRQAAPMMVQFLAWGMPPAGGQFAGAVSTRSGEGAELAGGAGGAGGREGARANVLDDSSGDVLASNFGYSDGEGDGLGKGNAGARGRGGVAETDASSSGGLAPRQRYSYRQTYFPWLFGAPQKQSASLRNLPKLSDPGSSDATVTGDMNGTATANGPKSGGPMSAAAAALLSSKSVLMSARAGSGLLSSFTGRGELSVAEVAATAALSTEEEAAGGLNRRTQSLTNAKFASSPTQGAAPRARRRKALDQRIEKLYVATSEQLASLGLEEGRNTVSFMLPRILGMHQVTASIYLWNWNSRIVITDIDGTITRSDVLGHLMPIVGRDWSQNGVTGLFSCIRDNGFKLMYLSARALAQANRTRQYIANLKQGKNVLPEGPIIISPDGVFPSLYREVIKRRPQEFKIECLKRIRALFPPDASPFYAGLGNRATDEESYMAVGIPRGKIFTINHKGEVWSSNLRKSLQSYASLKSLADEMFPHVKTSETVNEQEDFNEWNYWKVDLPAIDIDD
eukprot:jgi/Mesvir1/21035/Mv08083-RA.1